MSRYENHKGIARLIPLENGKTYNDIAKEILKSKGISFEGVEFEDYKDELQYLTFEYSTEYFYHLAENKLYKLENEESDDEDVYIAVKKDEQTVEYQVVFYNGGLCNMEALEIAFDKMQ